MDKTVGNIKLLVLHFCFGVFNRVDAQSQVMTSRNVTKANKTQWPSLWMMTITRWIFQVRLLKHVKQVWFEKCKTDFWFFSIQGWIKLTTEQTPNAGSGALNNKFAKVGGNDVVKWVSSGRNNVHYYAIMFTNNSYYYVMKCIWCVS